MGAFQLYLKLHDAGMMIIGALLALHLAGQLSILCFCTSDALLILLHEGSSHCDTAYHGSWDRSNLQLLQFHHACKSSQKPWTDLCKPGLFILMRGCRGHQLSLEMLHLAA